MSTTNDSSTATTTVSSFLENLKKDFDSGKISYFDVTSELKEFENYIKNNKDKELDRITKELAELLGISEDLAKEKIYFDFNDESQLLKYVAKYYKISEEAAKTRLTSTTTDKTKSPRHRDKPFGFEKYEIKNVELYVIPWTKKTGTSSYEFSITKRANWLKDITDDELKKYKTVELLKTNKISIEELIEHKFKNECVVKIHKDGAYHPATIEDIKEAANIESQ